VLIALLGIILLGERDYLRHKLIASGLAGGGITLIFFAGQL
jgi:hypothetical protein